MAWSEQTLEALRGWLAPDTWHKNHWLDEGRFFAFIASVWNDEHGLWDEELAVQRMVEMVNELHPELNEDAESFESYGSDGTLILDFLSFASKNEKFGLLTPS